MSKVFDIVMLSVFVSVSIQLELCDLWMELREDQIIWTK
ncbi:MAG: hypothetical protein EZS28_045340, partial [Streblomastix strix]